MLPRKLDAFLSVWAVIFGFLYQKKYFVFQAYRRLIWLMLVSDQDWQISVFEGCSKDLSSFQDMSMLFEVYI